MVSPCCRHKPFGVTAILVWMCLMSVISIFYVGHYWPATLVHAGLRLSLHCIVRVNDPMHVWSLLFCVCWVWYYTYFFEYYSFTYAMFLVCSIVPCPAVALLCRGFSMAFELFILRRFSWAFELCSIASMKIHYTGTIVYYVCLRYCSCHRPYAVVAVSIDLLVCL